MLGLFGMLNLGTRSLQTQRLGLEVAGQNLANVNNPAYARQRLAIETSLTINGAIGPQGTGADAVAIFRIRSEILDGQIQSESSVRGFLEAQQLALQYAQATLGTQIDRVSGSSSLADEMAGLFNAFQSLSTDPASMTERQSLLMNAASLATRFNEIDQRLETVAGSLNESIQSDVGAANELLGDIARLNEQIRNAEISSGGSANDLRDLRQQKIESLARIVKIDVASGAHGETDISIAGIAMISGGQQVESLQTYDAGAGRMMIRAAGSGEPLMLTGGSLQGTIEARDGAIADLRAHVNGLATLLISEVNSVHASGFSLNGSTGAAFFEGTNAADIRVNAALAEDPSLLQAAGGPGAVGDNRVALALAQLADAKHASLAGQTFSQGCSRATADLGQALASVNSQLDTQSVVESMLLRQRDSISGVSLDEEMTDLTKYQKAFAASARLITIVDEMLDAVLQMKR